MWFQREGGVALSPLPLMKNQKRSEALSQTYQYDRHVLSSCSTAPMRQGVPEELLKCIDRGLLFGATTIFVHKLIQFYRWVYAIKYLSGGIGIV